MSKADEFKAHAEKMRFFADSGEPLGRILNDGTLRIFTVRDLEWRHDTGLAPKQALKLGRWLIEMYEGADQPEDTDA